MEEIPWDISPEPKEQEEDLDQAWPSCMFVSVGSKSLDFFPILFGLSRIQTKSLTQGVTEGRISKIAVIHVLPSQFLLHFHTTWKHVYSMFPTLAKSLKCLHRIESLFAQHSPQALHFRVNPELLS